MFFCFFIIIFQFSFIFYNYLSISFFHLFFFITFSLPILQLFTLDSFFPKFASLSTSNKMSSFVAYFFYSLVLTLSLSSLHCFYLNLSCYLFVSRYFFYYNHILSFYLYRIVFIRFIVYHFMFQLIGQ